MKLQWQLHIRHSNYAIVRHPMRIDHNGSWHPARKLVRSRFRGSGVGNLTPGARGKTLGRAVQNDSTAQDPIQAGHLTSRTRRHKILRTDRHMAVRAVFLDGDATTMDRHDFGNVDAGRSSARDIVENDWDSPQRCFIGDKVSGGTRRNAPDIPPRQRSHETPSRPAYRRWRPVPISRSNGQDVKPD